MVHIEHFDGARNLLVVVNLRTKVAEHHKHSNYRHRESENTEKAQKSVCLDPADGHRRNCHEHNVDVFLATVAPSINSSCVVAYHAV